MSDKSHAKIMAATRFALKSGPTDTLRVSGDDLFYNPGWVDRTSDAVIAKRIAALVDKHTTPELRTIIDEAFA